MSIEKRMKSLGAETRMDVLRKTAQIISEQFGIEVIFRGNIAATDGNNIIVPSLPDSAPDDLIDAIIGFVDHEVGHIRHTDFTVWKSKEIQSDSKLRDATNTIEDVRQEALMAADYRGAGLNMQFSTAWTMQKIQPKWNDMNAINRFLLLCSARAKMLDHHDGAEAFFNKNVGEFAELVKLAEPLIEKFSTLPSTADAVQCAKDLLALLDDASSEDEEEGEGESDSGESGEDKSDPSEGDESDGEGSSSSGSKPADTASDEIGEEAGGSHTKDGSSNLAVSDESKELAASLMEDEGDGTGFHEEMASAFEHASEAMKDYRAYTTEFDETIPPKTDRHHTQELYGKVLDSVRPHVNVLYTMLTRTLLAEARDRRQYGRQSGRVNLAAVGTMKAGNTRVFSRRKKGKELNTYVEIIVDQSGSMSGHEIHLAQQTTVALAEALDRVGVPYGICGFTCGFRLSSYSRTEKLESLLRKPGATKGFHRIEPLVEYQYKTATQSLNVARPLIAAMCDQMMVNNADGASILRIAKRVMQRKEQRKILIVLSDGFPAAYPGTGVPSNCHSAHMLHVSKLIRDTPNLEVIGIGIDSEAVEKYYDNSVVVRNIEELPGVAMGKLKDALLGRLTGRKDLSDAA